MKRLLALLAALTMLLALAGCGGENTGDTQEHSTQAEETLPESDAGDEAEESQEEAESGGVTVSQSNLPDYETILNNSSAGAYGPAYGMVLRNVQNMARNSTEEEITGYLLNQLEAGNINEEGIDTILQALNLAG